MRTRPSSVTVAVVFLHAHLCTSRWANGAAPKRVSDRSIGTTPLSASKNEHLRAKRVLETLLPIFRTATMGVAYERHLP